MLRGLGLTLEDLDGGVVDLWPENVQAVNVFIAMSTQWRVGNAGAIGLDYAALPSVMRLVGVPARERSDVFDCVRILEEEAMATMREASK